MVKRLYPGQDPEHTDGPMTPEEIAVLRGHIQKGNMPADVLESALAASEVPLEDALGDDTLARKNSIREVVETTQHDRDMYNRNRQGK